MRPRSIAVVLALVCAAPLPVSACENAITLELDDLVGRIDRADRTLVSGTTRDAMRDASFVLRMLRGGAPGYELMLPERAERRTRLLRARAEAILALAVVRRDGRVDRRRWVPSSDLTEPARVANLEWALEVLRTRTADGEPASRARYGEALARFPARHGEARAFLLSLARGDLMPDAWGYRVLAQLSEEAGDHEARDRAVNACQFRAGELASSICPRLLVAWR